ncbi:M12 family metallo-peptidase, partial [Phenylobacterium aquaticum]
MSGIDLSDQQIMDALHYDGALIVAGYFTVSIPSGQATWPGYGPGGEPTSPNLFTPLTSGQASNFLLAVSEWDKIIAPNFQITDDSTNPGAIRIGFSSTSALDSNTQLGGGAAAAYTYSNDHLLYTNSAKTYDIWLNDDSISHSYNPSTTDFTTLLHELGHDLGLDHPFASSDGNGSANPLPTQYDSKFYTVMSYTYPSNSVLTTWSMGADGKPTPATAYVGPTTPMVLDIYVAQKLYGADPTTAAGDTTYSFDASKPTLKTIYDAGGIDTIDLTGHTRASNIDLTPGHYSSIDIYTLDQQIADTTALMPNYLWTDAQFPQAFTWENNLGIAYSTTIENVKAGSNNDVVLGNDAANNISGGAGADTISGGNGSDYLRGDDGNDSISGGAAFDDINGNKGNDTASGGEGDDWVVGGQDNDSLSGDAGADIVYGNLGNDTLSGGDGNDWVRGGQGDDSVSGGNGDDWIWGDKGSDTLSGGAGADIFHSFVGAGADRVIDFNRAEGDRVILDGAP